MKYVFLIFATGIFVTLNGQNVNTFNGAFSYDLPLMIIPSNKGNPINITASYQAGIQMKQSASEIGLGWNLNSENAIYRSVSGYPDDTKYFNSKNLPSGDPVVNGRGALYPDPNTVSTVDYDLVKVRRGLDTMAFIYPDFDTYHISGTILSGQLLLSYYKFYSYGYTGAKYVPNQSGSYNSTVYRKPQFHFMDDFSDTLVSRHYSVSPVNAATPFRVPIDAFTGSGYTNSSEPFIGKHLSGATIRNQNFDSLSGRLATSNLVEYFTNAEIDAATGNGFSVLDNGNIFIDYKSSHYRNSGVFPQDGIGYFRITGSNGLTYHYSLPVYELVNTSYKIPLNNDYSLVTGLATGNLPDYMGAEYIQHPNNVNVFVKAKTYNKTAVKWLLVAVTGADFVDKNNNHMVDSGDEGYWLSYDYQLWSGNFVERTPHYGFDFQYNPDPLTQKFPVYFPMAKGTAGEPYKVSGLFGSVEVKKSEVYHLSRIRTPSHSAIFIRDIRNDERSSDSSVIIGNTFKPAPDLFLKRIILFKNEQLDSLLLLYPKTNFVAANYPDFSFLAVNNNNGGFFTSAWFTQNYNAIIPSILKNVSFNQDYSLCRNYHNSINANYVGSSVLTPPGTVEANIVVSSYNTSGKLTLNGIYIYDYKNQKVIPSTQFDYNASNSTLFSNPDYNPRKTDYWGYYKHDATTNGYSKYTSVYSRNYTKSWSLLKITDPLGGVTEMEYESNSYKKVIDNEAPNGVRGASFIYRIKMANTIAPSFDLSMEEGNGSSNLLTEFPDLTPGNIPGLKSRVCIPYFEAACFNSAYCVAYNVATPDHFKGFVFGDCAFALQAPSPGATYHITGNIPLPASNIRHAYTAKDNILYNGNSNISDVTVNSPNNGSGLAYAGNGFLMCETPIGYEVYGSGIRLKNLKVRNSLNEVYTTEYTYEDGVATGEMDRFNYQVLKAGYSGSVLRYDFLEPKSFTLFDLSPYVGYSKVTVKNLGQINAANGKVESTFITDPSYKANAFKQNYNIHTEATTNSNTGQMNIINECVAKFPNAFGLPIETKVFDKNNNMVSRTTMEYEETEQGALTENFHFQDLSYRTVYNLQTVNILRKVPVILKRTINYGMGGPSITETIARDELTGEDVTMRSSGQNNSSSLTYRKMAFSYYQPIEGLNFTQPAFRKMLPLKNTMYSYATIDSALTTAQGNGYSASFSKASYKLYSRNIRQRQYNSITGKFTTSPVTLPNYIHNRSFIFDAGESALNEFGLLNKSLLYANPLNLSTINNYLFWEPTTTYNWKLIYEYTLLDKDKNLIEARDANNRFNAKRFAYNGYHESAKVTNCNHASFTFADFETPAPNTGNATIDGDILVNNHVFVHSSSIPAHTGVWSIQVSNTPISFTTASESSPVGTLEIGLQSGRIYRASVWVHVTNLAKARLVVTINGMVNTNNPSPYAYSDLITANSTSNLVTTIGAWSLLQVDFVIPEKFVTGTGTPLKIELKSSDNSVVFFDDFVFHPVESNFSASVYNLRNGRVTSTIDGNGLATGYIYDASGRVLEVWSEVPGVGYKQIKKHTYNYARGANN